MSVETLNIKNGLNDSLGDAKFHHSSEAPEYTNVYFIIDDLGFMNVAYYQVNRKTKEGFWSMRNGSKMPHSFFWLEFNNPILPF